MTLRWRWTLALLVSALVLLGGVTLALELGLRALVREQQREWAQSRRAVLEARLTRLANDTRVALDGIFDSGEPGRVLDGASGGDDAVLRAIADWAVVQAKESGVDEILVLDAQGTVLSSALRPERAGRVYPARGFLLEASDVAPALWSSDAVWMLGWLRWATVGDARYLVATAWRLDEARLATLREELSLRRMLWVTGGSRSVIPGDWQRSEPVGLTVQAEETAAAQVLRQVRGQLPWLAGAALLLSFLLSPWLASGLARPLSRLSRAVGEIGQGSRRPDLPRTGPREVRELSDALGQLVLDLDRAEDRIRRAERRGAWREIARRIAHEIRNTLSPLSLALDNVETAVERDDESARTALATSLSIARDQLESLNRLVSEFHGFARTPRLHLAPFDGSQLLDSVLESARAGLPQARFALGDRAPLPPLRGDVEQLRRALHNLLKNAAESVPGETVTLAAGTGPDEDRWWVSVRDLGPGLDAGVAARLGEPYLTTKPGGTGLGLPLVVQIAEAHGGRLDWRELEPRGLEMRLVLPTQPSESSMPEAETEEESE